MKKVISASRRIDLVAGYPDKTVELLAEKAPPEATHTVVVWTKDPTNMIDHAMLRTSLGRYANLFLHLTVTGMGGGPLEPRVPAPHLVLERLPEVVGFVGGPDHVRVRFDPIVHVRCPDGSEYTNLDFFSTLSGAIARLGVANVSISWMQVYRKVLRNLARRGYAPIEVSPERWRTERAHLEEVAGRHRITLHGCCVPGMARSRCIDGELLARIHPAEEPCSTRRARGQRELCGCTESYDIGWYEPCRHGCVYCYANPLVG
ncbi:MAG: DUF1848 family protein [Verrucomicrobia bacterium]|nr:DUF1848 family protein [Verrucomicrobiota bacterium]